ncbi:hypothetical protein BHE74_00002111 [Ensete ventricosum]|nr:hypothetical protein BHE74_00002111 [Ensete ventricosum]
MARHHVGTTNHGQAPYRGDRSWPPAAKAPTGAIATAEATPARGQGQLPTQGRCLPQRVTAACKNKAEGLRFLRKDDSTHRNLRNFEVCPYV